MTGDENDKPSPPPGESRTVFMPSPLTYPPGSLPPAGPQDTAENPPPDAGQRPPSDEAAEPVASEETAAPAEPAAPDVVGPDDGKPAPQATVWAPAPDAPAPGAAAPVAGEGEPPAPIDPAAPPPAAHEATVWAPSGSVPPVPPPSASQPPAPPDPGSQPPAFARPGSLTPRSQMPFNPVVSDENRRIQIGDVLNHIFEVTRFIGRGGMGEVFEGINVNTEERVAIKVILPHLAADPAVQAMFRKEARTLTRLSHPGLVQYRVLAQEPVLGVLYIVTEFIEGANLSDQLGTLNPTPGQLTGLLRRLAQGLSVAHSLGAIHRDISPDNIMLEAGKLERARIIDFGIAKDLEGKGGTIVGDGFAGKLNYVAPEQLGDFGRDIGAWTDVYSLGLTILATAIGKDVSMGATLVDAVDKRRAGVDISDAPAVLQPILERMLKPNPADRLRSMEEVLAMLDNPELSGMPGMTQFSADGIGSGGKRGLSGKTMALAGGGLALVLAGAAALFMMNGPASQPGGPGAAASDDINAPPLPPPADPVATARTVVEASFKAMPCSWLTLTDVQAQGNKVSLNLIGVSGKSAEALDRIERLLRRNGMVASSIDFSDVSPITANMCRPLEAINQIRSDEGGHLDVAQRKFEMDILPASAGQYSGRLGAAAVFNINLDKLNEEMSLVGLDEAGEMAQITRTKAELVANAEAIRPNQYRFTLYTTNTGWSGIMMLYGKPPIDANLTGTSKERGIDWADKFLATARKNGWKAEMVWYRSVDEASSGR
jgi:hypothetical protein